MFGRTWFAIVAALGALLLAAPASADNWGADRLDDGGVTAMLDAREQALVAKQVAPASPNFAAAHVLREPVVDDRFRIDATDAAAKPVDVSSGREIEWPQIAVGVALGLLLALGLTVAARATSFRPPVAR